MAKYLKKGQFLQGEHKYAFSFFCWIFMYNVVDMVSHVFFHVDFEFLINSMEFHFPKEFQLISQKLL